MLGISFISMSLKLGEIGLERDTFDKYLVDREVEGSKSHIRTDLSTIWPTAPYKLLSCMLCVSQESKREG